MAQDEKSDRQDSAERTPETVPTSQIEQKVNEVRDGGTVVGSIEGGEGIIHVGGPMYVNLEREPSLPVPERVLAHRAALANKPEYRRWADEFYIREEGKILPLLVSPYDDSANRQRQDLLHTIRAHQRLLVLGEPGMGKTVAMQRMMWETAQAAGSVVPIFVPLFAFEGDLIERIRLALNETGELAFDAPETVRAFLRQRNCWIMFDGLNEVPGDQRHQGQAVRAIADFVRDFPLHRCVVTSRSQDEQWRELRARGVFENAVVIQSITGEQVRGYLVGHLGEKGAILYERVGERLREMAQTPLILWLVKEAGAAGELVPGNRGDLYANFVSKMLRRDTDRQMDAEIKERIKHRALADLAYHLGQGQRRSCPRDEAVRAIAERLDDDLAEKVVGACARHGLLSGEESVWFAPHQTIQEHFAAVALKDVVAEEQNQVLGKRLLRGVRRALTGRERGLAELAGDDWWMETFVQLAGLVDADPQSGADWLVRKIVRANPWLAWWCVEEGRGVTDETREAVAERSEGLLRSDQARDRRRAVETLAQVRSERVAKPLFRAAGDEDAEVANLAVQALAQMGEAAQAPVTKALQGTDRRLWRTALRYLRALPDNPLWAEVPQEMWDGMLDTKDRRCYVTALARVRNSWTVHPLFHAAGDEDAEVAGLAVQALAEMEEAAQPIVEKSLESTNRRSRISALRCLVARPAVWAVQPLFHAAGNEDADAALLAVQALVGMGEAARGLVTGALRGEEQYQWKAALRYLGAVPDDSLWAEIPDRVWKSVLGHSVVWVEPGPFLMGSDKGKDSQARDSELPQHEVTLPGYWIGRYPVTNQQFGAFIAGGGYQTRVYWTEAGWQWKKDRAQPGYWDNKKYNGPQQPVVGVSWYEAAAYCRWLDEKTGLEVRLPSEAEWEKAARGTDGRIYPWGNKFDKTKCNMGESGVGTTTPVGTYSPRGDSPYGCADMVGNVWEWCATKWEGNYINYKGDGDAEGTAPRVVRGGAFHDYVSYVRCAYRFRDYSHLGYSSLGFRVVVVPISRSALW
ncbi:MAG: SUMF1/EgtB/PvdO family nonheme iron enzyme [Chloroflexi bacterium]|nr:SUMF1/EgtB/PvdO family nonheme iron enzyme [Chloroflexota bacterium]